MTPDESEARYLLIEQHHYAYGAKPDSARFHCFYDDTLFIPIELFEDALRLSRQINPGTWAPPPGQVIEAACKMCWQKDPTQYRSIGGGLSRPRWYQQMLRGAPALPAPQRKEISA
jgi:hypothetical protein